MPETVALMHSFVGLAAVAIALATVLHTEQQHGTVARLELFIGCFIGAITFSASVFAFGKLAAKSWAKTLVGGWVKPVQAILFIAMIGFGIVYFMTDSLPAFYAMAVLAVVFGWMWIAPIRGGQHASPCVFTETRSSGWAGGPELVFTPWGNSHGSFIPRVPLFWFPQGGKSLALKFQGGKRPLENALSFTFKPYFFSRGEKGGYPGPPFLGHTPGGAK